MSIVLFPDLMAYCFTDNVFLPSQEPLKIPLSSLSITKVFRRPNKFCFPRKLLCCLMLYCEPVFVTVCDSCSCVDVKSGLLCLTLDLNPCNKRKRKRIEQSRSRKNTRLHLRIPFHFFIAASLVLYNRTERSQGFFIIHNILMVNWTLGIVLFPNLMVYCFAGNVFLLCYISLLSFFL